MSSTAVLFALPGLPLVMIFCAFFFQHYRWKRRRRLGNKRWGFYPSTYALGIAFQQIQLFVAPNAECLISEILKEQAEEDDDRGTQDPARDLERQLRRIRRGERIDTLTTLLPNRD
jgi:hypothetical protein